MAEVFRPVLTEETAKKVAEKIISEVYSHRPTELKITIKGSIDSIPEVEVKYKGRIAQNE